MTSRKLYEFTCEQCGKRAMGRRHARFCGYSCSGRWRHAAGLHADGVRRGEDHYAWKSELDNYRSRHARVGRIRGKASSCVNRHERGCTSNVFEWSHTHGANPMDPESYRPMCKPCHTAYDELRGATHPCAKLTWEQVRDIRARYVAGVVTQKMLAGEYLVSEAAIGFILSNRTYREAI